MAYQQGGCTAGFTEPFALRVIGDSMTPEFDHGHIIIVDPGHELFSGVYAVLQQNDDVLFGQYIHDENGQRLCYLHPEYPSVDLNYDFEVKGVVVQRSTGRRKHLKHYEYR